LHHKLQLSITAINIGREKVKSGANKIESLAGIKIRGDSGIDEMMEIKSKII